MEFLGYELEAAEGTFELLVREALHPGLHFFDLVNFDVSTNMTGSKGSKTTATVTIKAQDGVHSATATGTRSRQRARPLPAPVSLFALPVHRRMSA